MVGREESDGLNVAEKKVKNCDDGEGLVSETEQSD